MRRASSAHPGRPASRSLPWPASIRHRILRVDSRHLVQRSERSFRQAGLTCPALLQLAAAAALPSQAPALRRRALDSVIRCAPLQPSPYYLAKSRAPRRDRLMAAAMSIACASFLSARHREERGLERYRLVPARCNIRPIRLSICLACQASWFELSQVLVSALRCVLPGADPARDGGSLDAGDLSGSPRRCPCR